MNVFVSGELVYHGESSRHQCAVSVMQELGDFWASSAARRHNFPGRTVARHSETNNPSL